MASVISLLKSIDRSKLHAGVPLQSFSMGEVILIGAVGWLVGWGARHLLEDRCDRLQRRNLRGRHQHCRRAEPGKGWSAPIFSI